MPTNVNTAPPEVLGAILGNAHGDAVAKLVAGRAQQPYASVADFRARLPPGVTLPSEVSLAVRSDFFYVSVEARQGTTIARARALLVSGRPLASRLPWRIGLELRAVVAGGLAILDRIDAVDGDVFRSRPVLSPRDWLHVGWRTLVPQGGTA